MWKTIRFIVGSERGGELPDRESTLAAFHKIDPQHRPLFAAFAADAIASGRNIRQWDQKELLASVLKGEIDLRWNPSGVTPKEKNLLALATITSGIPLVILRNPPVEGFLPPAQDYSPARFLVMSGRPSESLLNPLTPAILGEFFVLEHFKATSDLDDRSELARTSALAINPQSYRRFFEQAARNFPGHPTVMRLRVPAPADASSVFNWAIDAANLVEALEEKENSDLCLAIYRDLRQAAFEPMRDGLATIRYRVAKLACDLGSRFFEFRVCATWGQGL